MSLRAGPKAPADLGYIISLPDEGIGAMRLAPGDRLALDLVAPKSRQITLAVVGIEPDGSDMAACCLSNQRVHLPAACAPDTPVSDTTPDDLALQVTLAPDCTRQSAAPVCSGVITVSGTGADMAPVTLAADLGESLVAQGADCSPFAKGRAICQLPVGTPVPFDLSLDTDAPDGAAGLCGEIGIGVDDVSRTLALQEALARAGYPVGKVDGAFGPATMTALGAFVADAGLPPLDSEIPPEALALLGIRDFADAQPANNRACALAKVPSPPLVCDARTTRVSGKGCACRFKSMKRVSDAACACPKGESLGANGCIAKVVAGGGDTLTTGTGTADTGSTGTGTTDRGPACDPATTVLRAGLCQCRVAGMVRVSDTACSLPDIRFCPDGTPELPGIPCGPTGPACSRFNVAGECCDDLGPEDPSCR